LIRLITQIQQEFGQRLPVATVFGSPTIESLAAVLSGPRTAPAVVCRVIPIKPQGTRPPFICLGASPLFLPLARLLGPDQPFCGLDLTELNKVQLPKPCRLEDLGAYVVEAIRKYQPEGPYSIGGWCLYGVLAYEAARQLLAQGHQVELLTLIDSPNSAYDRSLPPVERFEMKAQKLLFHLTNLVKSRPAEMIRYSLERIRIFQGKMKRRRERIVMEAGLHEADLSLMDIDPIAAYAATTYEPPPYSGRVLMVQSEERPPGKHWQMPVQWADPLSNQGIIHYVQGGHQTMFEFPYVEALAANMKRCFDEVGERPAKAAASAAR
jgi:thioesterase domain-containing protein